VTAAENEGSELPFQLSSGYLIYVNGRIGDGRKLRFLLDTGSTVSLVDPRVADKKWVRTRQAESLSFNRMVTWDEATVPEMQFGPIRVRNARVFVGKLDQISEFTGTVDAVIGLDLLSLSEFTIDYDARKIVFHPGTRREERSQMAEPASRCVIVECLIQGQRVRLIVDTGFSGLLLYKERILKRIPKLRIDGASKAVLVGKSMKASQVSIPDVVVGSKKIDVRALLVNSPPENVAAEIDGVLGPSALNARKLHFDLARRTIDWD
jgi:predicted aspartyl protease